MGQRVACAVVLALAVGAATAADAQQPTRRRQPTIEIRGQVPTPQVVTVRPREVPSFSRQVLVPRFYDHDFWPDIQEGYDVLTNRMFAGLDSATFTVDSIGTPDLFALPKVRAPTPLRPKFATIRRQLPFCATRWWCPSKKTRIPMPADSAALFDMRSAPAPMAAPRAAQPTTLPLPASELQKIQPKQRWCTPAWWCPSGGREAPPPPPITPATPAPADTTRRPPGTSPASALR
jgi:hypothetical protein